MSTYQRRASKSGVGGDLQVSDLDCININSTTAPEFCKVCTKEGS